MTVPTVTPETEGELAVRRQACAGRHALLADVFGQRVSDREIARSGKGGEVGLPVCHGDNVSIDLTHRQNNYAVTGTMQSRLSRMSSIYVSIGEQNVSVQVTCHRRVARYSVDLATSSRALLGRRFIAFLLDRLEIYRQRRALAALDDHMLKDIGLTRCDVEAELAARSGDDL